MEYTKTGGGTIAGPVECAGAGCRRWRQVGGCDLHPRITGRPWDGEFPLDRADDMDAAAVRILVETMRAGRGG